MEGCFKNLQFGRVRVCDDDSGGETHYLLVQISRNLETADEYPIQILTGAVPFSTLEVNIAVMRAVIQDNQRPLRSPLASPTGIAYLNAWEVAEVCWSRNPEARIHMLVALERLRADPSLS